MKIFAPARSLRELIRATPRRLAFVFALTFGALFQAQAGQPVYLAILYSENDDFAPGGFSRIIEGIEGNSDVVVVRMPIIDPEARFAALTQDRLRDGMKLVLNGSAAGIAVLYPDIGEPYRGVFTKIIEGIEDKTKTRVTSFAIGINSNAQDLAGELKKREISVVIALGRHGLKAAAGLDREISVIGGGVISPGEAEAAAIQVMSLSPDPALLFGRLKALLPGVRRIFVVYDPRQSGWMIRLAREAARREGVELDAREAQDLKAAVRAYQEILAASDAKKDALWLPQDSTTVEDSVVLPMVLQESWDRSLPVFSSNVAHVRRGALFSLYPNNLELGRNLAGSALGKLSGGAAARPGIVPLRDVLAAINMRTASHLGLAIGRQPQGFDLLLPEQ